MTAAYRVVVAERKDISIVSVICEECGTIICLKMETARIPESCGSCGKPYPEKTRSALAALGRFHREAATAEQATGKAIFQFEIKQKD